MTTHLETDLVERLRALSRREHDDLSIGDEAADAIETLQAELSTAEARGYARGFAEGEAKVKDEWAKYETLNQPDPDGIP